jgi:N-acetylmuramoyl-L-alanine amidase
MKRFSLFFVLFFLLIIFTSAYKSPGILQIKKVVIDAGHGGEDPGAIGKRSKEKNIALAVALKLGNFIKTNFPDIEVIYTRKTDVFIELYRRAQIANSNKADLFISIHCNSTKSADAYGTETWVLGLNKSQANLEVAKKENGAILFEKDYSSQYDGFDPYSPEGNIIFSLYQNAYLDQSLKLADMVQKQFVNKLGRHGRGVKQAGFLVLYKTTMPAALIELGFVSNPQEEDYLLSENGQNQLASGIFKAFKEYKASYEGGTIAVDNTPDYIDNTPTPKDSIPDLVIKDSNTAQNKPSKKEVFFRVQFTTSPTKKATTSPEYKGLDDVRYYIQNKTYKYTSGNFSSMDEAVNYQHEVQKKGFKDAFVVAFMNEERITPADAVKYIKEQ